MNKNKNENSKDKRKRNKNSNKRNCKILPRLKVNLDNLSINLIKFIFN